MVALLFLSLGCTAKTNTSQKNPPALQSQNSRLVEILAKTGKEDELEGVVDFFTDVNVGELLSSSSYESFKVSEIALAIQSGDKKRELMDESIQVVQQLKPLLRYCLENKTKGTKYSKVCTDICDFLTGPDRLKIYQGLGSFILEELQK
jgi:hypothetical protein